MLATYTSSVTSRSNAGRHELPCFAGETLKGSQHALQCSSESPLNFIIPQSLRACLRHGGKRPGTVYWSLVGISNLMQIFRQYDLMTVAENSARNHRPELETVPNMLYTVRFCAPGLYSDTRQRISLKGMIEWHCESSII